MKTTFVLHVVQHTTQRFEQTCSTHLLQGGHSNFHNVPLVWEDLIPAPIDLVEGRGINFPELKAEQTVNAGSSEKIYFNQH